MNKLDGDWKGRIKLSKALLSTTLPFDSCNEWLAQGKFFAEQAITRGNHKEIALRCLYLLCSFVAIAEDFCIKELSFFEQSERSKLLQEGFTYGSRGSGGIKKIFNIAMASVEEHATDGKNISRQVRISVDNQFRNLNTAILGEFFSKNEVAKSLFSLGKEFEQMAMNRVFVLHTSGSVELRSMLFCLYDFWGIIRTAISD